MNFLRRLGSFWLVLVVMGLVGYFCAYNLDWIVVEVPQLGQFRIRAAIAYFVSFLFGASIVTLFFGIDIVKKSMEVRSKNKRIRELEALLGQRLDEDADRHKPALSKPETTTEPSIDDSSAPT